MKKLHIFKSIYVCLVLLVSYLHCQDTIDLLCGDAECKKIVAEASTVMKLDSVEKNILSFRANDRVRVMGRNIPDGPKFDYVLVEISGRRGWAPARMLKETRVLMSKNNLIVTKYPSPFVKKNVEPQPVVPPAEPQPAVPPAELQPVVPPTESQPIVPLVEPQPIVPPAEPQLIMPPTESQPIVPTVEEIVKKTNAKDLLMSEAGEELTDSEELLKMLNETSEETIEDITSKEVKMVTSASKVIDTTVTPPLKEVAAVAEENSTLSDAPITESASDLVNLTANAVDSLNETQPAVEEVPITQYSTPQEPVDAATPAPSTIPPLEPVQVVEIPPQPVVAAVIEQENATLLSVETTTPLPMPDPYPKANEPIVEATIPIPNTTEKVAELILEASSNETDDTSMEEPEVVTENVVEVTTLAPKEEPATVEPEKVTTTPAPIQVVTTTQVPVQLPVETTTQTPPTVAPSHQHHAHGHYGAHDYTTSAPIEEPAPPNDLQVPVETTTPLPVTPTPHHHHYHDHHGHDYLKVESTTQSLPMVEETTTTPAPPPQLEPKGVGSVVELTGSPPEVKTTPAPSTEVPRIEEISVETESFLTNMWAKVSGLFGNEDAKGSETKQPSFDDDLQKILFPGGSEVKSGATIKDNAFCARFTTDPECAKMREKPDHQRVPSRKESIGGIKHPLTGGHHHHHHDTDTPKSESFLSNDTEYVQIIFEQLVEMIDLIVTLALTALVVLIFILGYYCINKSRREGPLLAKINGLERHLMASLKENSLLKAEVLDTRNKLVSIEDNSFGSNDMVIALRKELDGAEQVNQELQDQVDALEKELENAAEAGLELNKMVSELLSNQTGSDSIISSVEELQRQLNEQQETIVSMNSALALKSRENSELQILIGEQTNRLKHQFEELQSSYDQLKLERSQIEAELSAAQRLQNDQIREITETKGQEIQRLSDEVDQYKRRYVEADAAKRLSVSKVEALETCVQEMKKGVTGELGELMDVAELKADLLAVTKEKDILRESLDGEADARRLLEERVRVVNEEVSQLKKDYTKAEQEKTATETRLEILSAYFKEKEVQLQKELSIKEEKVLQKQGETTSTVERVRAMQDEIQSLKSQNDALRAEIEAQSAANKQQNVNLENRAHEAWLSARQAERKLEEARSEASALRRKLTSMAEVPGGGLDSLTDMPSPIRVESPSHPNVPPPIMMPPFMPPPPFGLPPPPGMPFMPPPGIPPFMPGGDLRSGRLMSPPPPNNRYSPNMRDRDYSPDRYSPDSRYNYSEIYETETDFSPPPSPPPRQNYGRDRDYRDGPGRGSGKKAYSPPPSKSTSNRSSKTKGVSSGSQDSIGGLRKGGK